MAPTSDEPENLAFEDAEDESTGQKPQYPSTQGTQEMMGAVQFANQEVGDASVTLNLNPIPGMNGQTVAMGAEDVRAFLQGAEQTLTAAIGQAMAKALQVDGSDTPKLATDLAALAEVQTTFATNVATVLSKLTTLKE